MIQSIVAYRYTCDLYCLVMFVFTKHGIIWRNRLNSCFCKDAMATVKDSDDFRTKSRISFSGNQKLLRNSAFCIPQGNKFQLLDKLYLFVINDSCNH